MLLRRAASRGFSSGRIAVVGSGPSGFYSAKYLLKEDPSVRVDVLDALPSPFGSWPRRAGPHQTRRPPPSRAASLPCPPQPRAPLPQAWCAAAWRPTTWR